MHDHVVILCKYVNYHVVLSLKLVSAIFFQIFSFHQMIEVDSRKILKFMTSSTV